MKAAYYHTRHACGHSVYWSDAGFGMSVAGSPCPWCGAATGKIKPSEAELVVVFKERGREMVRAVKERNKDGTFPVLPGEPLDRPVFVHHMTGDVCCDD